MFLNKKEWEETKNYGMLKQHSYFIPFDKCDVRSSKREDSSRFQILNGEWEFRAHDKLELCELDEILSDSIAVPSCIQMKNYDQNQYTNHRYPFSYNPPYIEQDIPTFHYRRKVEIYSKSNVRLVFEGVDAAFYVFLNGKFVGYSQITHKNTEFDITDVVTEGENLLDVIVLKWCAGSYLEDQDKWRFSGIIRDVYLLYRDKKCVEDYKIETILTGEEAEVHFTLHRGCDCEVEFNGEKKHALLGQKIIFRVKSPKLWSAEIPNLYDLVISAGHECIYERVGIREVKIKDGILLFNGKPIKLLGVNRHEFHPKKGAAISIEDIEQDLILMKQLHVNAIRTSHYPNMPEFYKICDEYGFYVMNEADVEAHGVCNLDGVYDMSLYNTIANDALFEETIVERILTMYERDKNRACIMMFSLGNEAGYGKSFERAAKELKKLDNRPIHYESHVHIEDENVYYNDVLDVASRMYPEFEWVKEFVKDKRETRPLVICEYCHAMGNGPGDFKEYWEILRSSERYAGGFVWEWADHGMIGSKGYLYGGDFGEEMHDGNFCIDGIVTPERKIKSGTLEMSAVYQPIEMTYEKGILSVKNRYYFKDFEGVVKMVVKVNGEVVSVKQEQMFLRPGQSVSWDIEQPDTGFAGLYLTFTENTGLVSRGYVCLKETERYVLHQDRKCECQDLEGEFYYKNDDISYRVNKQSGNLTSLKKGDRELLSEPMQVSVMRAPIDNEMYVYDKAYNIGVYEAVPRIHAKEIKKGFRAEGKMLPVARRSILNYEISYYPIEKGLRVVLDYCIPDYVKRLPCVGLRFAISDECKSIRYFGYGGSESYVDMTAGSKDIWREDIKEQYFHYVKPQESGNHTGTEWVEFEQTLRVNGESTFDFSAIPYSEKQLMNAKHDWELSERGAVYIFIGLQEGIGSNACGPDLKEEYLVPRKKRLVFELV